MNKIPTRLMRMTFIAMTLVSLASNATTQNEVTHLLTFGGRGDSETVDKVVVQNITHGCSVEMDGDDVLLLTPKATGIDKPTDKDAGLTVEASDGRLLLNGSRGREAVINIYSTTGFMIKSCKVMLDSSPAEVDFSGLIDGIYIANVSDGLTTKSIKWLHRQGNPLCMASAVENQTSDFQTPDIRTPDIMRNATTNKKTVELYFEPGDLLRFTGSSGKMTTITMLKPRTDAKVWFDFLRCEDTNGYNYTTVRMGDLLWMTEDLHYVEDADAADVSTVSGKAFYNLKGATAALPQGWRLPTQGEVDNTVKKVCGSYSAAPAYFLDLSGSGTDSTRVGLTTRGWCEGGELKTYNDYYYLLTRSTKNGVARHFRLNSEGLSTDTYADNDFYPVRGVRTAPSEYTEMLETLGLTSRNVPSRTAASTEPVPPLGETYSMYLHPQSIAYNFTSGQLNSGERENRSGLLYKDETNLDWHLHEKRDGNFLSDVGEYNTGVSRLRKMASMTNNRGSQYIVEMQWSRPMLLWSYHKSDGSQKWDPTKAEIFGRGGVYLTVLNDRGENWTQSFTMLNEPNWTDSHKGTFINLNATMQPLTADELPWFKWDDGKRPTETRYDYVQRIFQLLTADFTGDGVDEIIINVDGEVWVFDGAVLLEKIRNSGSLEPTVENGLLYYKNFNLDDNGNKIVPSSNFYLHKPVTRLAVGDFDGDRLCDLLAVQAGVDTQKYTSIRVRGYSKGNLDQQPVIDCIPTGQKNTESGIFLDAKIGNVSGGQYNDILILRASPWISGKEIQDLFFHRFMFNKNEPGNMGRGNDFILWYRLSSTSYGRMENANLTLVNFRGHGHTADIVAGDYVWRWSSERNRLEEYKQILPDMSHDYDKVASILADNIIAADPNGTGKEMLYYFQTWSTYDSNVNKFHFARFQETWLDGNSVTFNAQLMKYCDNGAVWNKDQKDYELMWWNNKTDIEWGANPALCAVRERPGIKKLKYKDYTPSFSEPRIHALLAAPPTYDYGEDSRPDYDFVTSWGYSTSSGTTTTSSNSVKASLITGFEHQINAPLLGTKLGGVEFTATIETEVEWTHGSSSTTTFGQLYEARDDDRVVMQITPYDSYIYEVVQSDNIDEVGGEVYVAIPKKPMTVGLALSDYDRLLGSSPLAPDLHQAFRHTIGNPFSYPKSADEIPANVDGKILWGANKWDDFVTTGSGGSTIREISLDETSSKSQSFSFGVETELVTTIGCAKIGLGAGYGHSNETTHEESKGFTVSACVPGLAPGDHSSDRKFFDWNLCWYKYRLGGQTFPVVYYVVKRR